MYRVPPRLVRSGRWASSDRGHRPRHLRRGGLSLSHPVLQVPGRDAGGHAGWLGDGQRADTPARHPGLQHLSGLHRDGQWRSRSIRAATRAGRRTGPPTSSRSRPRPGHRDRPSVRLRGLAQQSVVRHRARHRGQRARSTASWSTRSTPTTSATPSPSRGIPGTDPAFFLNVPLPAVPGNSQADNGQYESVDVQLRLGHQGDLRVELRVPLRDVRWPASGVRWRPTGSCRGSSMSSEEHEVDEQHRVRAADPRAEAVLLPGRRGRSSSSGWR